MLTRKHYVKLAAALRAVKPRAETRHGQQLIVPAWEQHTRDVEAVANALAELFPNFDYARFVVAAGEENNG